MIAAVILATAATVFFFQVKNRTSGTVYAIVEQDSKELMRLPLSEPGEYRISDGDSYNVIEITEGGVRMKEADCPDQICVSRGLIRKSGQKVSSACRNGLSSVWNSWEIRTGCGSRMKRLSWSTK